MKSIKTLLKLVLLTLLALSPITLFASLESDITSASDKLLTIKKWSSYKASIDKLIEKYKNSESVLNKLSARLEKIDKLLKNRNDDKSMQLKILLKYLSLKVELSLEEITPDIIIKDKEKEVDNNIDNSWIEDWTSYPWFKEDYIEKDRTILAWDEVFVYKQSLSSLYEASEVWKVIFYITGSDVNWIDETISSASLFLEWKEVGNVSSSKIDITGATSAKITFDNLEDFILTQNIRQMRLKINTSNIWFQKIGKTIKGLQVTKVWFDDIKWLASGRNLDTYSVTEPWEKFSIVPWMLGVRVDKDLSSWIPEINLTGLFWNNTLDSSNSSSVIELKKLKLSILWSSSLWATTFSVYNKDNSWDKVTWVISWNEVEFNMSLLLDANKFVSNSTRWEDYKILINWTNSNTLLNLSILKDWLEYDVQWISNSNDLNINLEKEIHIWTKNY